MDNIIQEILEDILFNGYAPTKEDIAEDYDWALKEYELEDIISNVENYLGMAEDNISSYKHNIKQ